MSDREQTVKWLRDAADRIEAGKLMVYHSHSYEMFGYYELFVKAEMPVPTSEK